MLSTLSISLPANLYFFSSSVCLKTWVIAEQPVGKTSKLSSAIFRTCYFRCSSFPDSLCLLVHFRLYYGINVHFIVLKLISHVVFCR